MYGVEAGMAPHSNNPRVLFMVCRIWLYKGTQSDEFTGGKNVPDRMKNDSRDFLWDGMLLFLGYFCPVLYDDMVSFVMT